MTSGSIVLGGIFIGLLWYVGEICLLLVVWNMLVPLFGGPQITFLLAALLRGVLALIWK